MKRLFVAMAGAAAAIAALPAGAQMSVTTFGTTDAKACFDAANDNISTETDACDRALSDSNLSGKDEQATLVNRGIVSNRAGRYSAALADFDAALDEDAALAEAWLNRGNTLLLMGRADDAIENYETALENGIRKAHLAWYNIGLAYEARGDKSKAREAYAKALEASPDFTLAEAKLAESE